MKTGILNGLWIGICFCMVLHAEASVLPFQKWLSYKVMSRTQIAVSGSVNRDSIVHDSTTAHKDSSARPKVKLVFGLDFRNSFFDFEPVSIWGLNAGIAYGRKQHHITVGYYWLGYFAVKHLIDLRRKESIQAQLPYYNKNDFWFVSLIHWENLIYQERWIVSIPLEIGGGITTVVLRDIETNKPIGPRRREFFFPAQIGIYGQWKATKWMGLSSQIGYRYSIFQTDVEHHFNGMYYSLGVVAYPELFHWLWQRVSRKKK